MESADLLLQVASGTLDHQIGPTRGRCHFEQQICTFNVQMCVFVPPNGINPVQRNHKRKIIEIPLALGEMPFGGTKTRLWTLKVQICCSKWHRPYVGPPNWSYRGANAIWSNKSALSMSKCAFLYPQMASTLPKGTFLHQILWQHLLGDLCMAFRLQNVLQRSLVEPILGISLWRFGVYAPKCDFWKQVWPTSLTISVFLSTFWTGAQENWFSLEKSAQERRLPRPS